MFEFKFKKFRIDEISFFLYFDVLLKKEKEKNFSLNSTFIRLVYIFFLQICSV